MSRAESAYKRRWYPARLLLPHPPRKSVAFQIAEAASILLPVPLIFLAYFVRARWRYHRRVKLGLPAAGAAPPPSTTTAPSAPSAATLHTAQQHAAGAAPPSPAAGAAVVAAQPEEQLR
jgi:hypothetical protein